MFVSKSMTQKVITVRPETSVIEARGLLKQHHIRHLPVVEDDAILVGIITDRDVRSALPAAFFDNDDAQPESAASAAIKVGDVMTADPHTVSPEDTIEDAYLMENRYSQRFRKHCNRLIASHDLPVS